MRERVLIQFVWAMALVLMIFSMSSCEAERHKNRCEPATQQDKG